MRLVLVGFLVAMLAFACSDEEPPRAPVPAETPQGTRAEPNETGDDDDAAGDFDVSEVDLELRNFVSGLSAPLLLTHAGDGSGRLFVVEQAGTIKVIRDGEVEQRPFLDISDRVRSGGEQGLLGLAFHPDHADNGRFFINYTDTAGDTVVARYDSDPGGDSADESSEEVLLKIEQPFENHNGGHLAFGPDGYLYIATGDGGSAGDPQDNGQDTGVLLGKLLRIDVDDTGRYGIPDDNPFAGGGGADEVWAYGLRNPWRFSFDEETSTIWIGDVGQNAVEEINRAPDGRAGLNYGWNELEGSRCYEGDCDRSGKVRPITEYGHDHGCSITGGFVYRGERFEDMRGGYFFGDFCSGSIWAIDASADGPVDPNLVFASDRAVSSFGLDEHGEMYVTDLGSGEVLRVVDAD